MVILREDLLQAVIHTSALEQTSEMRTENFCDHVTYSGEWGSLICVPTSLEQLIDPLKKCRLCPSSDGALAAAFPLSSRKVNPPIQIMTVFLSKQHPPAYHNTDNSQTPYPTLNRTLEFSSMSIQP